MNRRNIIILIVIVAVVILPAFVALAIGAIVLAARSDTSFGRDRVALIRVEGVIISGRGSYGLFGDGMAGSERIVGMIKEFREDKSVKSAVLRIDSPGGSPAASQEIYQEIAKTREAGKMITVSMGDVAASGGYYIASAADRIYADPATITGSIGVIMQTADMHKLLDRIGVDFGTIKSGEHKDMGVFSRPLTEKEVGILQGLIDDVFDQFVTAVSEGRDMPKEDVLKVADGRIFTGRQALDLNLIDELGSLEDALEAAARDAGIKGEWRVKEYTRPPNMFELFFGTSMGTLSDMLHRQSSLADVARRMLHAGEIEMR